MAKTKEHSGVHARIEGALKEIFEHLEKLEPPRPGAVVVEVEGLRTVKTRLGGEAARGAEEPLLTVHVSLDRLTKSIRAGGSVYDVLARSGIEVRGDARLINALTPRCVEVTQKLVEDAGREVER